MLFNSINFAFFLPIVFILYWLVQNNVRYQNLLLLFSSYFFYSCWDYRFLALLIFSTSLDYYSGIRISETTNINSKKIWFWLSIILNLGFLCIFKYYNFFISSFSQFLSVLGFKINPLALEIILPVGISFYTFHGLSYVIDIYKGRIKAEKNIVNYALFVSYFPLLVAGPIERAAHLLPQVQFKRSFNSNKAIDGLRQILWGLFKKIVIADNCAIYANMTFGNLTNYSASTLVVGAIFFAIQIYCDFSGYSDIAMGTSRLFGIELLKNFEYPYFSRDIAEFWRRWHISLSSWFKDYLYIPLGGSKVGTLKKIRNIFIIFIVSGFWHGANWTFIFWGILNATFILPSIIFNTNRQNVDIVAQGKYFPSLKELMKMFITFGLTVFAWIFFRSVNLTHAVKYILSIISFSIFNVPYFPENEFWNLKILFILFFFIIEWIGREQPYAIQNLTISKYPIYQWSFYMGLVLVILYYSSSSMQNEFIYFQF